MNRLLSILLLILLATSCASLSGSPSWRGADYSVNPPAYRDQVEGQRTLAEAQMAALGYDPRHKIQTFDIIPGTVRRPKGWAIPATASPTGFAGGMTESVRIWVVSDPRTGTINLTDVRHEWKHAILAANFFVGDLNAQHAEIQRSER